MTAFTYSTDPIQVDDWRVLELHPMCEVFPRMPDKEFAELRQSIVGSGLRFPIVLFEGLILDGRHRYEICLAEDIEPSFETYMGPGSAMSFVIDVNLRRRNLTEAQRLKVLTDLNAIGMMRMQAREKKRPILNGERKIPVRVNLPIREMPIRLFPSRRQNRSKPARKSPKRRASAARPLPISLRLGKREPKKTFPAL